MEALGKVLPALLGYATVMSFLSYMPQIIKAIRTKSVEDISALSYLAYASVGLVFTLEGVYIRDVFLSLASVTETLLCLAIVLLCFVYREKEE